MPEIKPQVLCKNSDTVPAQYTDILLGKNTHTHKITKLNNLSVCVGGGVLEHEHLQFVVAMGILAFILYRYGKIMVYKGVQYYL